MKVVMRAGLIAALLFGGTATALPETVGQYPASHLLTAAGPDANREDWRPEECRFATWDGRYGWSTEEVVRTIRCAAARWSVPGGVPKALAVARCESGDDLMAPAGVDGYAGTFQQAERYWDGRRAAYNPPTWDQPLPHSPANPRANVVVSVRMASAGGWGDWTCA